MLEQDYEFVSRDISWLSFNQRVLQEAEDESNPLIERLRFLGIFSNNRDEFFRVRVATVRRMRDLGKKGEDILGENPQELLDQIQKVVLRQEKKFTKIYQQIRKELSSEKIFIVNEDQLSDDQLAFVADYFKFTVRPTLVPIILDHATPELHLKDKAIYLAVKLSSKRKKPQYALIELPTGTLSRFLLLPAPNDQETYVMLLDDVIRLALPNIFRIFEFDTIEAFNFKMTRDAELDLDDDLGASYLDKVEKSLSARKKGEPVRFVYDREMPEDLLGALIKKLNLKDLENVIPAGRYHNFKDFMSFPSAGADHLQYDKLPPLEHPLLRDQKSYLEVIGRQDVLITYPYQQFSYVINLLREAAIDPKVRSIQINLYRVAKESRIINALINAAQNGKEVIVIVELQARFDEENNIKISNKLKESGVKVVFGVQGLKVHSKLMLISRKESRGLRYYAHIGTGNFHEGTARIYGDHSLLTSHPEITREVAKVFEFFQLNYKRMAFKHLMVSPFNQRRKLVNLIQKEINNAKEGQEAYILLKLNNLVDESMIRKLYEASEAGVKIRMMVRGICSLVPGVKGMSENVEVYSVVDRFLEHARVMVFANGGDALYYISSADWMTRNLDHRIEVATPIFDKTIQQELRDNLEIQFSDNQKARIINKQQNNPYRKKSGAKVRSQFAIYNYYRKKLRG